MEIRKVSFIVMILLITSVAILPIANNSRTYGDEASHILVYSDPATYTTTVVGETFTVEVKIKNASNLQGFEFKLGYDTAKLDALEVSEGSFLKGFRETLPFKLEINETLGSVWVAIVLLGTTSAQGDGTLAKVTFTCTETGQFLFDLYDTKLGDPDGNGIDHYVTDGYSTDEFVDPLPTVAQSAIDAAISKGMNWLAAQENLDGSWGTSDQVALTGFPVLKFETHAIQENIDPLSVTYEYYSQVRRGLDYIFLTANPISIALQPAGDPDTDHDGLGVYWAGPEGTTYYTGIAMLALASSKHPEMTVSVIGSAVNGWTFKRVLGDAVDYFAFGQTDTGLGQGGWGYGANSGSSDNSNTGYAVQGLAYAEAGFGCTIPSFVRSELNAFINIIQDPVNGDSDDGGSWYNPDWGWNHWVNILKTGNLLFEMKFYGDTNTNPRVQNAVNYLVRHWNDANDDPGWKGMPSNPANYQATYTTMKGLEAFGIDQINGIDWFNDFANVLVFQQNPDGSWPPCYGSNILGTEWALLTLQKAVLLQPAHDVAVVSVTPSTNFVYRPNSLTISVVVNNLGEYAETFKVAVFYGDFPTNAQWNTFWNNVRGDINKDGYVNQADADILASNFGKHGPPGTIPGDLNNDGWVDIFDAIILTHDFGKNIWSYFHIQGGVIATQTVSNLLPGDSRTLVFTWNTAGYASGDYIIGAYAWLVVGETNEANNKIVDGVVTIKIHYRLTVNTDPLGLVPAPSVDPPSPDGFYDAGTLVTLTANAVSGYTFKDWEVNPPVAPQAQADKVVITMDQDCTATAVYTFDLNIDTGFKAGDSLPYASDPYLDDILCVLTKAKGGYWLAGTSPGTFDYAITINNIGTTTFTSISLNISGHNDLCLDSQNPIRVVDASGSDTAQFEISGTWPTITISSKSTFTGLPASGSLYVTVHLDYALKGHIFSSSTYSKGYTFTATVSGISGANQGDKDASGSVALLSKKVTVIFGFVTTRVGAVEGAEVDLYKGTQLLYSGYTDADGFYCFVDGVDGVGLTGGVTYKVSIAEFPTYTQTVTAVSKTAVPVNFKIPYYLDERLLERSL